jgi:hydrogenase-4 component E
VTTPVLGALIGLGLAEVLVRRRSAGVLLVAAQSLLLGSIALSEAAGAGGGLWVAASILLVRALALPVLLWRVIAQTREPRRVASERHGLPRLVVAVVAVLVTVLLVPRFGLEQAGAEHGAVALVVLGIIIAAVRRPVVFQAIGFLVAENGVYLASLSVHGGFPAVIELALLFDLVVALGVAAAFGGKIHEEFGTSDTSILGSLRD